MGARQGSQIAAATFALRTASGAARAADHLISVFITQPQRSSTRSLSGTFRSVVRHGPTAGCRSTANDRVERGPHDLGLALAMDQKQRPRTAAASLVLSYGLMGLAFACTGYNGGAAGSSRGGRRCLGCWGGRPDPRRADAARPPTRLAREPGPEVMPSAGLGRNVGPADKRLMRHNGLRLGFATAALLVTCSPWRVAGQLRTSEACRLPPVLARSRRPSSRPSASRPV